MRRAKNILRDYNMLKDYELNGYSVKQLSEKYSVDTTRIYRLMTARQRTIQRYNQYIQEQNRLHFLGKLTKS